jgi:UDP-glucose 4-epimerase
VLSADWKVTVFDDFSSGRMENLSSVSGHKNLDVVKGDILDTGVVAATMTGADICFHLAAIVSNIKSLEQPKVVSDVNVGGTINVLDNARKSNVNRIVFASSCGVYGDAEVLPVGEKTRFAPRTPYAASKAAAEQFCMAFHRTYGLGVVCLRYTNVYGPRRSVGPYSGVMVQFAKRLTDGLPPLIYGDGKQTRDFIYSTDVAEASVLAATSPKANGAVINVGTGVGTSILELATLMANCVEKGQLGVIKVDSRSGEIRFSRADVTVARELLGFEYRVGLPEGIRNFTSWYAAQRIPQS